MKKLEQVKEEYAKNVGYNYWSDLLNDDNLELSEIYDHYDQVALELAMSYNKDKMKNKRHAKLLLNGWQEENGKWISPPKDSQGYEYTNENLMSMDSKTFNKTIRQ